MNAGRKLPLPLFQLYPYTYSVVQHHVEKSYTWVIILQLFLVQNNCCCSELSFNINRFLYVLLMPDHWLILSSKLLKIQLFTTDGIM